MGSEAADPVAAALDAAIARQSAAASADASADAGADAGAGPGAGQGAYGRHMSLLPRLSAALAAGDDLPLRHAHATAYEAAAGGEGGGVGTYLGAHPLGVPRIDKGGTLTAGVDGDGNAGSDAGEREGGAERGADGDSEAEADVQSIAIDGGKSVGGRGMPLIDNLVIRGSDSDSDRDSDAGDAYVPSAYVPSAVERATAEESEALDVE